MTDTMTPRQHYDTGTAELERAAAIVTTDPETSLAQAAVAQAHFQAGLLSAILEDQARQQEDPDGP
jgi:hypothetical protein